MTPAPAAGWTSASQSAGRGRGPSALHPPTEARGPIGIRSTGSRKARMVRRSPGKPRGKSRPTRSPPPGESHLRLDVAAHGSKIFSSHDEQQRCARIPRPSSACSATTAAARRPGLRGVQEHCGAVKPDRTAPRGSVSAPSRASPVFLHAPGAPGPSCVAKTWFARCDARRCEAGFSKVPSPFAPRWATESRFRAEGVRIA